MHTQRYMCNSMQSNGICSSKAGTPSGRISQLHSTLRYAYLLIPCIQMAFVHKRQGFCSHSSFHYTCTAHVDIMEHMHALTCTCTLYAVFNLQLCFHSSHTCTFMIIYTTSTHTHTHTHEYMYYKYS